MVRGIKIQTLLLLSLLLLVPATSSVGDDDGVRTGKRDRFMEQERPAAAAIFPKDVSRAATAIRLAEIVIGKKKDDDRDDLESLRRTGIYLESGTDAVYLARIGDDYCAAAFRGTMNDQPGDWITNLYLGAVEFEAIAVSIPADDDNDEDVVDAFAGCDVHRGYHEAYADFEHRERVEDFLRTCRWVCPECETVLTGHSQGGAIAQIAALYQKLHNGGGNTTSAEATVDFETDDGIDDDYESAIIDRNIPYVVTFAAPQSLGAGCFEVFSGDERRRWFRYIMATKGTMGNKLVYDPIPLLYAQLLDPPPEKDDGGFFDNFDPSAASRDQTYARNGGLAFIGHEVLLSTEDPSAVLLSEFDGHRYVDLKNVDLSGRAHYDDLYSEVLQAQDQIYKNSGEDDAVRACSGRNDDNGRDGGSYVSLAECPKMHIPSGGFAAGSLCNEPDESSSTSGSSSTCAEGTTCEAEWKWWFLDSARFTCQPSSPAIGTSARSEGDTLVAEYAASIAPTSNTETTATRNSTATEAPMIADAPAVSSGFRQTTRIGYLMVVSVLLASFVIH